MYSFTFPLLFQDIFLSSLPSPTRALRWRGAHSGAVSAPPDPPPVPGSFPDVPAAAIRVGETPKQRRRACKCRGAAFKFSAAPAAIWATNALRGCLGLMPAAPAPGARLSPHYCLPPLCMHMGVPNFSLVFTNKRRAPVVIYSWCCLRHLPGESDPAMFLTYFCTYLDRMLRPSEVSLY